MITPVLIVVGVVIVAAVGILFAWVAAIEGYVICLHNHDINDIRERLRKLEAKEIENG